MAEKATLYLENNKGMILDFTRSPQACDVYDLDGNLISGGGGGVGIDYIRNIPITHVFPEGKTLDDFEELGLYNFIEVDADYEDQLDGRFGQNVGLYNDSIIILLSINGI